MSLGVTSVLIRLISSHWTMGYEVLGPATATAGLVMMAVSAMEMFAGAVSRVTVLHALKGPGPWMLAALWGTYTAFEVVTMLTQWALEWGEVQGRVISHHILSRRGRARSSQLSRELLWEEHRSGSATSEEERRDVI
jgi:hypothetical protein